MSTNHPDMFTAAAAAAGTGGLLLSGPGTFLKSPGIACETKAIRDHGAKAAFLGVPFIRPPSIAPG